MKSSLHMLDAPDKQKNKHIVFLDSKKEGNLVTLCYVVLYVEW